MKIFAHRGASGYAPENTLTAIKKAIEMKADGIEIDIQLTKDGKIVVMHDWKVDRTTTGRGFVYELDFDYIRSLDAGQWYTKDFIGEVVPTLEEVLDILPNDMMLNIEIKDTARKHSNIEEKMLEVLKKYPEKFDNIIVSSFHHDKIKRLQELEPKLKLALLTDSEFIEIEKYLSTNGLNSYSYHPEINLISKEDVEILHEKGIKVFVWTVNKEEDLAYLIKLGGNYVLSILVDKPEGITVEDTADLTDIISPLLDTIKPDPFPEQYMLEISSPGLERPLKTAQSLMNAVGHYINVSLYQAIDKVKVFEGDLTAFDGETLTMTYLDKTRVKITYELPLSEIVYDFFDKLKSIDEKGAGYLYMQGSGKEKAQYWESPYLDTTQFDFIKELQLYITKLK